MWRIMNADEFLKLLREERGIEEGSECLHCSGFGTRNYPTTGTWRAGAGGSTLTVDVCDRCWGSGNKHKPWPSHRLLERKV